MKVVIKIGGSVAINEMGINSHYFSQMLPILKMIEKGNEVSLCIGGGRIVRNYFASARALGMTEREMELIGIDMIKAHVRFLAFLTKKTPIFSREEIKAKNMVIGGLEPGKSTDHSAALLASIIKADMFVKMTNVAGIYDKDPATHEGAKLIECMSFSQLKGYASSGTPGNYGILDAAAIEIIVREKITTVIMDGRTPENLAKALSLQTGTIIKETLQGK
ncbi:MAG: hypothetical protein HY364_05120 [Candidatus Aenigmarchaeota archaeon]|nr:hypothetical protein [Candidatus Aenigmarchaeota archaeon]